MVLIVTSVVDLKLWDLSEGFSLAAEELGVVGMPVLGFPFALLMQGSNLTVVVVEEALVPDCSLASPLAAVAQMVVMMKGTVVLSSFLAFWTAAVRLVIVVELMVAVTQSMPLVPW